MLMKSKCFVASLLVVVLSCVACQDEDIFQAGERVVEGIPTQVTLKYATLENIIETRAAQTEDYENRIENIYLFVFNSAGTRADLDPSFFTLTGRLKPDQDNPSLGKGKLDFTCPSLNDATIVAIANVTDGSTQTAYQVTKEELDAIDTFDQLKAEVMMMDAEAVGRGALFMMTGYAQNKDGSTAIDIAGNEQGTGTWDCTLKLQRTDAKIEVNVTSEAAESDWTGFSFRPQTWRVVQVPRQSLILPADAGDADGDDCLYFSTDESAFETLKTNETGTANVGGGFVFYMPENRKTPQNLIDVATVTTAKEQYALREKWTTQSHTDPSKPGQTVENVAFENANPHSTYLEFTGHLTYNDENGKAVDANTRYYVHLGYANQDPNDYNTLRNRHYIYNITVRGINNIEVEVEGGDPRPGHEGDVVVSEREVFDFDCHYDRRLITLNIDDILSDNLGWGVSTIFSNGIHRIADGDEAITKDMRDYRWIKFAINKEYGVAADKFVKYPGDQNYDDPYVTDGANDNASSPYYTSDGRYYPDARLRDINQLLKDLKADAEGSKRFFETDGRTVAVTVFVDENLYIKDPTVDNAQPNKLLWKNCVNKPDRLLHIVSEPAKYSSDGNSSLVHSIYTFKQKSIRTIYNTASAVKTAWGLETVMEGDSRWPVDEDMASEIDDNDNGRLNTWMYIQDHRVYEGGGIWNPSYRDLEWTDVLNTDEHYALNSSYQNVFYATLMRNRDLNGDNVIDENEVRWYLAAINQLTDIYIGEYALDQESRLYPWNPTTGDYPPNERNNVYWHYASSTYQGSDRDGWSRISYPYVVWAEEGPSKGNYISSKGSNGSNYAYRCLRNLGLEIDDIDGKIDDFVQVINNNDGTYTFDLSYLDPKALRDYYVPGAGTYTRHNEKSEHNLPYRKFTVSAGYYPPSGNNWNAYQTWNPCAGDGYRVPNLRELLIFTSRLDIRSENLGHLASFTSFSMCDFGPYGADRMGYTYNPNDGSMGPANNVSRVRGVKDEPQ